MIENIGLMKSKHFCQMLSKNWIYGLHWTISLKNSGTRFFFIFYFNILVYILNINKYVISSMQEVFLKEPKYEKNKMSLSTWL